MFSLLERKKKFSPKTYTCVFIGYSSLHKVYRCYHPPTRRVFISRHVVFDENTLPYVQLDAPLDSSSDSTRIATFDEFFSRLLDTSSPDVHSSNSGEVLNGSPLIGVGDHPTADVNAPSSSDQLTPESPVDAPTDALDETAEPIPTTDHNVESAEPADHNAKSTEPAESLLAVVPTGTDDVMTAESEEPNSSAQDSASSDSNVFSIYDPQGVQLEVDLSRWFNTEPNQDTQAITIQATPTDDAEPTQHTSNSQSHHMVTQQKSKYMPVRHMCLVAAKEPQTINVALSSPEWLAPMQDEINALHQNKTWILVPKSPGMNIVGSRQLDVKNAFLHGHLQEEVYMSQPPGFKDSRHPDSVRLLKKAPYGIKQAPRAWFDSHTTLVLEIIDELGKEFAMKDLGPLHFFLGIEVIYFTGCIHLNQSKYAVELLAKTSMALAKPISTPLAQKHGLQEAVDDLVDASLYRSIVGSLQYLTLTRLDIAHAMNLASQFMQSPNNTHYQAVKRILRYVKGTTEYGLRILSQSPFRLYGFSYADWRGCPMTRRSITGYNYYLELTAYLGHPRSNTLWQGLVQKMSIEQ
ncbi:PREDICTED: uncharacterized protein LOC109219897 [Nicotiana attenuata]|uniref:uncharacterized protein LOC109219897 n=1 Tax=Nicotiana attenuata TaxID=49451 RepID=UPI00090575F5|nr:PREDICTED: uncharacterized protein LOC109219897 [Nicotiana attenuata]